NIQLLTLKATVLDNLNRYNEATALIDKALNFVPNYTTALDKKAVMLGHIKDYRNAIVYLDKSLSINPDDSFALTNKRTYLNEFKLNQQHTLNSSLFATRHNNDTISGKAHLADYTFMVYMIGSDLEAKSFAATKNIR